MKKSWIAVSVIIALGAVWTGASWYTGKQLAQNIDMVTADMNKRLQEAYPNSGIKLVYRDYQGGVFSSKFALVLQSDTSAPGPRLLAPGTEIVMNETLYHGPLPLAQVKTFNLVPSLASLHSELGNNSASKPLFDLLQGQPFLRAQTRIAFSGDTASVISLLPVDASNHDGKFIFSGSDITLDMGHDLRSSRFVSNISKVLIEKINPLGQKEQLALESLAIDANSHRGKFDLDLGDGVVSLKSLTFVTEGGDPVSLNNAVMKSTLSEDVKNVAGEFTFSLDALLLKDRNLGAGQVKVTFSQLDGEGTRQFAQAYQQLSSQFIKNANTADPTQFQHQVGMTFLHHLPQLLRGNPSFAVSPVSWKNAKGEMTLNLTLDLRDPVQNATLTPEAASDEEAIIRRSVQKLDISLNAPMEMLAEAMVQVGGQPATDQERQQLANSAQEQVKMMASLGEMNQMTVTKDNIITSALHYADNQVDFNGHKMSLAEFLAPFIEIPNGQEGGEDATAPDEQQQPATTQP